MNSRTRSQSWIALSLAAVLAALIIEPVAHEPRLAAQVAQDSRRGLLVARRGFVSGAGDVSAVVVTVEADYGHAALVTWKNYRTRLGWNWICGGWQGEASSRPYRVIPAEYISRADGGDILHPIDAGAWV